MNSSEYSEDIMKNGVEGLNPLLPYVAGIIETLEMVSLSDIQTQLKMDLGKNVSSRDVTRALENGIRLGVFKLQREFKVCREFTTQELKKLKSVGDHLTSSSRKINTLSVGMDKREKNIMEYVKRQREERRKKLHKKRKGTRLGLGKDYECSNELSRYLCQRCKKSLEKELMGDSSTEIASSEMDRNSDTRQESMSTTASDASNDVSGSASKDEHFEEKKKPEKSRLLVEKNPLETEPPYYDIFT